MPRLSAAAPSLQRFAVALLLASASTFARAAAYEGFDYPVGPATREGLTGGSGFRTGWLISEPQTSIVADSLSDPTGTLLTTGNHLRGVSAFSLSRPLTERPGTPGTEFWVSFLMRREKVPQGLSAFSGLHLLPNDTTPGFFIRTAGLRAPDDSLEIGNGFSRTIADTPFEADRDYFLVTRFQVREGNDAATLWVNPTPGVTPTTGGVDFLATDTRGDLGIAGQLYLAFESVVPTGVVTHFDELRTGATYAEVAPAVPEPAAVLPAAATAFVLALRRRR